MKMLPAIGLLGFCMVAMNSGCVSASGGVAAKGLRCEYLSNPLAVEGGSPRLSWTIEADGRGVLQAVYQVLAASSEAELKADRGDLWDSGPVESDAAAQVAYAGKALRPGGDVYWKVRIWTRDGKTSPWSEPASFRVGLGSEDWKAQWVSARGPLPEGEPPPAQPSPYLRKAFDLSKAPRRAVLTATALGLYELRLNGRPVSDSRLAPEWTNYNRKIQYQAYDVTGLLRKGPNVLGAVLGEGWYAGRIGISHVDPKGGLRNFYGRRLALLARLEVEFEGGETVAIATDGSWKATADGAIRSSCILDGETVDARKEMPGWDAPGFDDGKWAAVEVVDPPAAKLVAQPDEPVRVTQELLPAKIAEPKTGMLVVDFGQEVAGVCRVKVRGPAGTEVVLRHAEVTNPDGTIYRDNLRMAVYENDKSLKWGKYLGARQEDRFVLRGGGDEEFEPRFTYHGFRYVEVTGLPSKDALLAIAARAFHSAPAIAGAFQCSSPLLDKLHSNIVWTLRDNLHSVPTDCPQRDERLGWMGDMLVFAQPACYEMDMAGFFTKWIGDIRDAQADDGRYPDVAPHPFDPNVRFSGVPAWGDAGTVVPWTVYVNYGDRRALEVHFDSARRWVDWIHAANPDLLWRNKRNNDYGDWLNGDTLKLEGFGYPKGGSEVPKEIFATAFFQRSTALVGKMAAAIGKRDETEKYSRLAEDIRAAFLKAYVKDDGEIQGNTQAGYAIALGFDLLPESLRPAAAAKMAARVHDYKDHISTGFHSTIHLMNELTRWGQNDLAYKLVQNRTLPSWGYTIEQGATTIWERWDGYVEGRGFQDPGMNSFCHYAIGSVAEWMYRTILGINPDEAAPGWASFTLRPRPGGGLEWARGFHDTIRGRITSDWRLKDGSLTFSCTIPPNSVATVYVPAADPKSVMEGGKPAAEAEGLKFLRAEGGAAVFEAGSGAYKFTAK